MKIFSTVPLSIFFLLSSRIIHADSFEYQFGRPLQPGEKSYNDYRQTHAEEAAKKYGFKAEDVGDGMDTWHWWVGVDNPGFWRDMAKLTGNKYNYTNVHIDILRILTTSKRSERFKELGIINDPDCVEADKPDQFGLMIDRMKEGTLTWNQDVFGYSSGIIGLQLFKNKNFDAKKWSLEKYLKDPASVEPPYNPGMACVFCHIGFNPHNPPTNPAEPKWENLTSSIGNQYLQEGKVFAQNVDPKSFIYQYLTNQEHGTSETSRFPTDFINNPTNINSIFRLKARLGEKHVEQITPAQNKFIKAMYANAKIPEDSLVGVLGGTAQKPTITVPHILTDGADSTGVVMASVRVYVNEGMMHKDWYATWPINPFNVLDSVKRGFSPREFDIQKLAHTDSNSPWTQTEIRMPNMATFLLSYDSFPLDPHYLPQDSKVLERGKVVFADNCARCHSSKIPENLKGNADEQKKAWRELVLRPDFLKDNYLSDDLRHSVEEIGTNAQRALGTNAQVGSTWAQMSSETYKAIRRPLVALNDHDATGAPTPLYNPLSKKYDIKWTGPSGFYRTPTLVNIWATAPFFHNNSLGIFNGDPSIPGRLAAFKDAMEKLLYPERRRGIASIKVLPSNTSLPDIFPGLQQHFKRSKEVDLRLLTLPKGTPINLVMNLHPSSVPKLLEAYIAGVLDGKPRKHFKHFVDRRRSAGMQSMLKKMVELSTCPDFIEDRGHTFGKDLSAEEKTALTEYAKYF